MQMVSEKNVFCECILNCEFNNFMYMYTDQLIYVNHISRY